MPTQVSYFNNLFRFSAWTAPLAIRRASGTDDQEHPTEDINKLATH